jgi:hypothetical protein
LSIEQQPATFQVAGCSSINPEHSATSAPLSESKARACFAADLCLEEIHHDVVARLGTSWWGRGVMLVLRLMYYVTNLQVKQYTYIVTIVSVTTRLVAEW